MAEKKMLVPEFVSWANATQIWYEHCPDIKEPRKTALLQSDIEAMNRLSGMAEPILIEIGQVSLDIESLESRRRYLSVLYKELENQFNEHRESYTKRIAVRNEK
ncbi:hypothetical protein [Cohnella silvisoli]|uniref:Uncharacterized protein n=1 Tax=Cohnella silvisoli TaxID=2873699 RepID=A0ABV1L283_9BACL|nr:hypothetical protein [Cohnella silvisoli]MCD9025779.1 hypothetical protein [Cohnella silvisoli]